MRAVGMRKRRMNGHTGALHRIFFAYIMMAAPTGDAVLGAGGENSGKERKKMKRKIRTIMCCCGNGVGTSLVMQMTIEEALACLGVDDVEVLFGSLSDLSESRADLFVVSEEVLPGLSGVLAIGLSDLMDEELAAEQLKPILGIE